MKKTLALLLSLAFLALCSACGNDRGASSSGGAGENTEKRASRFASVAAGDVVTFGSYEQDNNPDNGPEPIEWIVLEVKDGKALLLSRYGLDAIPYNTEEAEVTWETCTLRKWLNSDFLGRAFSGEEQACILTAEVDNGPGQGYGEWSASGGNNTQDKLFLLSFREANRYFGVKHYHEDDGKNTVSRMAPTAYAIAQGAWADAECFTADGSRAGLWWLRSPGSDQYCASSVDFSGPLWYVSVTNGENCVRPAFWLDL